MTTTSSSEQIERLRPFEVVCVMRERTPLTREILQQLPNLRLIASTGPRNASIDTQTATDLGIAVTATGYDSTPTIEFTWTLILASMRGIDREAASLKATAPELVVKMLFEDCNRFGATSESLRARPRGRWLLTDLIDGVENAIHEQARMAPTCRYDRSLLRNRSSLCP
jgi:lactate dehydrogenase-like 2-hydroxyacid dehydrogenase